MYVILAADTNAYWVGARVTTIGNAGGSASGLPTVTLAAAGTAARGVVVAIGTAAGPYINPADLTKISRPSGAATVDYYALVVDDPNVIFEIQEAGAGSTLTTSSISRNVNTNTGTRTGTKTFDPTYLDNNTVNTTATLDLKILQLVQRVDNAFGQYQKWLVILNNHEFRAGTTSS
jgi:hypothetical protein